jgi:hypothetical protein
MSFKFHLDSVSQDVIDSAENATGLGWVTDLLARKGGMTALAEAHPLTQAYAAEHKADLKNRLGLMEPKLRTLLQAMLVANKATLAAEEAAKTLAPAAAEAAKTAAEAAKTAAEAVDAAEGAAADAAAAARAARARAAVAGAADAAETAAEAGKTAAEAGKTAAAVEAASAEAAKANAAAAALARADAAASAEAAKAAKTLAPEAAKTAASADRKLLAAYFDFSPCQKIYPEPDSGKNLVAKNMLVAVLNEDESAFKKAFASLESEQCKKDPHNYVKENGNADDAYNNAHDAFESCEEGPTALAAKLADSSLSDFDLQKALRFVADHVVISLHEQNKVAPSDEELMESASDENKEKVKAENYKRAEYFVKKAMQDEFDECESERNQAQADLKAAKKAQTAAVLALKSKEGKVNYAIAYFKSIFVTLSAKTAVEEAERELKTAQENLDIAKAAGGWVFGSYLTPKFKDLISKKFKRSFSTKTQLENALDYTPAKEVHGMSKLNSIGSSFVGAVSAVKSFPGKVGGLFATAWESLKGMFKAAAKDEELDSDNDDVEEARAPAAAKAAAAKQAGVTPVSSSNFQAGAPDGAAKAGAAGAAASFGQGVNVASDEEYDGAPGDVTFGPTSGGVMGS